MKNKIADSGLLIAFLDRGDVFHDWAARVFETESPPFHTSEVVLAEVSAVLGRCDEVLGMVETGDLVISLSLEEEASAVRSLARKYKDQPMDLADACCVRLAEKLDGGIVYTVDETDFRVYRKHGRQFVPCVFPTT
jgi:predicted nucleic acid-binding protein